MSKHKDSKDSKDSNDSNGSKGERGITGEQGANELVPFWQLLSRWPEWRTMIGADMLRVEQFTRDGKMVLRVEIPGVDPEKDIDVTVDEGVLRVHAERSTKAESKKSKEFRSEFSYGSFDRVIRLPAGSTSDDVAATYLDGILEIDMPVHAGGVGATKVPISHG